MFVGGFVGSPPMNFVSTIIANGSAAIGGVKLQAPIASGAARLGFRGEDVRLTTREQGIPFVVRVAEPMGSHILLTGKVENDLVRVVAPSDTQIAPGAAVGLTLDPARLSWMDAESGAVLGKR
jgi:multiple sugar transport system ATP-binding protein